MAGDHHIACMYGYVNITKYILYLYSLQSYMWPINWRQIGIWWENRTYMMGDMMMTYDGRTGQQYACCYDYLSITQTSSQSKMDLGTWWQGRATVGISSAPVSGEHEFCEHVHGEYCPVAEIAWGGLFLLSPACHTGVGPWCICSQAVGRLFQLDNRYCTNVSMDSDPTITL